MVKTSKRSKPSAATTIPDEELERRALAAYFRYTEGIVDQPTAGGVNVRELEGLRYVTIANGHRLLACYRVRHDGKLKRLVRVPSEIEAAS